MTRPPAFRFASARTANRLVAGVPAAARLARAFGEARPGAALVLTMGDGGALTAHNRAEIARIAPGVAVTLAEAAPEGAIPGEALPDVAALQALLAGAAPPPPSPTDPDAALDRAAHRIIRATAKPGDGMVARHLNRRLSQAISTRLLRCAWVRPGHATALTALAALAMLACLFAIPTPAGLVAGAVLFQIASVIDGVDGEIARAAHRSSRRGASLDSLVDAFTNCAFLAGAAFSFGMQGDDAAAGAGAAAAALQLAGLTMLGCRAWSRERVVHFDSAKSAIAPPAGGISAGRLIKDLTSRDFYCLAFMIAALTGMLREGLMIFCAASAVWLVFVIRTMIAAQLPR